MTDGRRPADRLFVPVKTEHYRSFEDGTKQWELRGVNAQFNERTVIVGRPVEIRRGYSTDDSLWGTIAARDLVDNLRDIVYHDLILSGSTRAEFLRSARELLGQYDRWIAFRPDLDIHVHGDREVPV